MSAFGYSVDKKITDVLKFSPFTISAEVVPPRNGEDQNVTMEKLQQIIESGVHFLSVTKGAGGSLRGGSLPMAQVIKDRFNRPCVAHFTCRDLVAEEVENLLMDHHYFGIRNILALRGDPPMGSEEWKPRDGGYSYAYELIEQIVKMNGGEFLQRKGFSVKALEKTDFSIGAAVYPEHPDAKERKEFSRLKFEAGAQYGITQMLFNPDYYERLLEEMAIVGINAPILPGLRILKNKKQAQVMTQRFGCHVPEWYVKALPEDDKTVPVEQILVPFYSLVEQLKKLSAPGVHLFILSDTATNVLAAKELIGKGGG